MRSPDMPEYDFKKELLKHVLEREFEVYTKKNSKKLIALAENHAIKMLEEIVKVLDERIPSDEQIRKILEIMFFFPVPPHIG